MLDPMIPDLRSSAGQAERLATLTRDRLADRLRWVPFVDWFVVTEDEPATSQIRPLWSSPRCSKATVSTRRPFDGSRLSSSSACSRLRGIRGFRTG